MVNYPESIYVDPRDIEERKNTIKEVANFFKQVRKDLLRKLEVPYKIQNYRNFLSRFPFSVRDQYSRG